MKNDWQTGVKKSFLLSWKLMDEKKPPLLGAQKPIGAVF
jgi:hypothetical protein